jgi:DNA-3-methyladenine glycosylase I
MASYCEFVANLPSTNPHRWYHDNVYGFRVEDDNELFARLVLEINQAGLSWGTILNKWRNFYTAYHNFEISTVAAYTSVDVDRLLNDSGIIRNRLKVAAAIYNAQQILKLQAEYGSFKAWLDSCAINFAELRHQLAPWQKLFKQTFKFTGGEIVNEFLMSTGYLPGAHTPGCPILGKINQQN